MLKKSYLLSPGPTPVPEKITSTFAQPIMHHRTTEFEGLFQEVRENLKYLFQTEQDVLTLAATGTGAMEAAVCNLFKTGDTVITLNAGKFGERWTEIAEAYQLKAVEIASDRGRSISPAQVEAAIKQNPQAKAVLFQASETSTGVRLPTAEICTLTKKAGLLSVCDAITACGVFELPMDEWGLDVLITGSQKALMIPPGLAFIAFSKNAWKAAETSNLPKYYFNLLIEKKAQVKNQTAWTPAISLIQGLQVALQMIREEGLENIFRRHEILAKATRAGVTALGLELFALEMPSDAVTAVKVPSQISDGKAIPKIMRTKYGVTIAGGQSEMEGKIFRLSHFGYVTIFDVVTGLSCLELVLNELGYSVSCGTGVGAALKTYQDLTRP